MRQTELSREEGARLRVGSVCLCDLRLALCLPRVLMSRGDSRFNGQSGLSTC